MSASAPPRYCTWRHIDARHHLEQLPGNARAGTGHRHIQLAAIGFGVSDKFRNAFSGKRGTDNHRQPRTQHAGQRSDIAKEVEVCIGVERNVDCRRYCRIEKRVPVRRRADNRFRRYVAGGARAVLDDDLLTEPLRQPLTDQARTDVSPAAGRESRRSYVLVASDNRAPAQNAKSPGSAAAPGSETQKFSAGKSHGFLQSASDYFAVIPAALTIGHHFAISAL